MLMYNNIQNYQVDNEGCDPFEWGSAAKAFWEGEFDKSCEEEDFFHFVLFFYFHFIIQGEEANAGDDAICNVFSTYYMDVETPWMIVAPLEEIEPTVHPCAPEYPENPDFWAQWRQQLYGIALELSQVLACEAHIVNTGLENLAKQEQDGPGIDHQYLQELPENGMFVSNCPHHVSMLDNIIWGEMEVASLDFDSATLTYKQVVLLRGKIC